MKAADFGIIGLILDIVGVLMLWRYGLPPDVRRGGVISYVSPRTDPAEASKAKRYDRCSNWAIGLIVAGFLLQLIGAALGRP